jgi:hypothetical protein
MENTQQDPRLAFIRAMIEAQKLFKPVQRISKNPYFKSKYAPYEEVCESVMGPLNANNILVSHKTRFIDGMFVVETTLTHIYGHSESSLHPVQQEKTGMQAMGSGETYGKRYNLVNLTAVPIIDEDDDGNTADNRVVEASKKVQPTLSVQPLIMDDAPLSFAEINKINDLIGDDNDLRARILEGYKVKDLCNIPKHRFDKIITTLTERKNAKSI